MTTLNDFFDDTVGKKVDFDGQFGAQCVDLFRQYNKDVFGYPHTGGVEGAKDLYLRYDSLPEEQKRYERIRYFEGNTPQAGDVIIWDATPTNKYGHVAIVLYPSRKNVIVYEQDGFRQDGAKVAVRKYDRCLGWLRKKRA
jgi:hypothetical protein